MAIPVVPPNIGEAVAGKARGGLLSSRRQRSDVLWGMIFIAPQVIGLLAFSLIPVVYAFILSLVEWDGLGSREFVGLDNFRDQFADSDFRDALIHTFFYTAIAVPGGVSLSLLLALAVNHVKGKTIYRTIFFLPTITSSVAVSMVWLWMLNGDFGLLNVYLRE